MNRRTEVFLFRVMIGMMSLGSFMLKKKMINRIYRTVLLISKIGRNKKKLFRSWGYVFLIEIVINVIKI